MNVRFVHLCATLANCYCPSTWTQVAAKNDQPATAYGECVFLQSSPSGWYGAAKFACTVLREDAFLASEFTQVKHDFLVQYMLRHGHEQVKYHIGLSYNATMKEYLWQQVKDGSQVEVSISIVRSAVYLQTA